MYAIITYDVQVERIDPVRHVLRQYLAWVQNSVFEGEITEGNLEELRIKISSIIDKKSDSILIYSVNNPKWIQKRIWGREKENTDNLI